jgi:DNA-binding NarL/FixJ family response regulator
MRERVRAAGGTLEAGRAGRRLARRGPAAEGGAADVIRVGVADDQALVRDGFRYQLGRASDLELVGDAADGEQAVELARRRAPDVLLMDLRMPVLDGIEATRRICSDPATAMVRVLVLTTFHVEEQVYAALRAGASGFLLKDVTPGAAARRRAGRSRPGRRCSPPPSRRSWWPTSWPARPAGRSTSVGSRR